MVGSNEAPVLAIKIANKGRIGVTISQAGLRLKRPKNNWMFIEEKYLTADATGHRLEPGAQINVGILPGGIPDKQRPNIKCGFATTVCGMDVETIDNSVLRKPELAPALTRVGYAPPLDDA